MQVTDAILLRQVLTAWDSLPEGNYRPHEVESWLRSMAPVMQRVRERLGDV